jgi:hypothetical protein
LDELTRDQRRIIKSDPDPTYAGMSAADKGREDDCRRVAKGKGWRLEKEPGVASHAGYMLMDADTVVAGDRPGLFAMTLDDVEAYLREQAKPDA